MSLELHVVSGSRAGERERFDQPVIAIGRHPRCDFRFDPERDRDVSARHAEIRAHDGTWVLRDLGSTNGTFVNGTRLAEPHLLRSGDVISFGEHGPRVAFRSESVGRPAGGSVTAERESSARPSVSGPGAPKPMPPAGAPSAVPSAAPSVSESRAPHPRPASRTTERIAVAVGEHTRRLRAAVVGLGALLVVGVGGAYWMGGRESRARETQLASLARANDSLARAYEQRVASLAGRVQGLDSTLAASKTESDELRRTVASARGGRADSLAGVLHALESRRHAMLTAAQVDYSSIADRDGPAVTLIAVQWADGTMFSGSGFCVRADGAIVTNRHLVARADERPTRIAVIFSDTRAWLPAHVVTVDRDADLALIQLDRPGPFPTVAAVAPSAAPAHVGRSVAIIGYPLGTETPMEGSGMQITARSTLVAGTLSKNLSTVLQIDAYAGEGSSGSPVFDTQGTVIGVVYGGAKESGGRIVYAVPSDYVGAMLGGR